MRTLGIGSEDKGINDMLIWIRKVTFFHKNSNFLNKGIGCLIGFLSHGSELVPCESKVAFGRKVILEARPVGAKFLLVGDVKIPRGN